MMTRECPACSAENPDTAAVCEYCGSSIVPLALSVEDHKRVKTFAQHMNEHLVKERIRVRRIIFSIFAGIVPFALFSLIALYHMYKFSILNLVLFFFAFIILAYIISTLIYTRKTNQALHQAFKNKVSPDLNAFLNREGLPRWQFDQIAQKALKTGAPLKRFLLGDEGPGMRNGRRIT